MITYLRRDQWGAYDHLARLGWVVPITQFVGLVVHHTVIVMHDYDADGYHYGDLDDISAYMRYLQGAARPDLGSDVPYSFVLFEGENDDDVVICEGRGFYRTGAHTIGYNSSRWGCALAGDYTEREPSDGQWAGLNWLGAQLADPVNAQPTLGHRDTVATQCPGNSAYPLLHLAQPPFTVEEPKEHDMPEYVIRNAYDTNNSPWIAVYAQGHVRTIGGDEAAFLLGTDPNNWKIPVIDEKDTAAYQRTLQDALT